MGHGMHELGARLFQVLSRLDYLCTFREQEWGSQTIFQVLQAEAEACIQALRFASDHGMRRVVIETDVLNLNKALDSCERDLPLPNIGVLFREARFMLLCKFLDSSVKQLMCQLVIVKPGAVMLWAYGTTRFLNL